MENVTHSLLGAALAKTRFGAAAPAAPAALVLAANFPDLENLVLAFFDKPTNMIHHRSVTHALFGLAVQIPLLTLVTWHIGQAWRRRRNARRKPANAGGEHRPSVPPTHLAPPPDNAPSPDHSFGLLLAGVGLAMLSHPLLDWFNTYGVRPLLPFDGTWYHGDLAFIADPYLWLIFGGATALAGRKTRAGSITLAVLALLLTTVIIFAAPMAPPALQVIWPTAVVSLALARCVLARRAARDALRAPAPAGALHWRRTNALVAAAFILAGVYVGLLGWAGRTAWHRALPVLQAQLPVGESVVTRTLSPQPANPLAWEVVAQTQAAVYRLPMHLAAPPGGVTRVANGHDHPLVRELADTPAGRAWRTFARQPIALVARHATGRRVYLLDARYGLLPPRDFASFTIDVPDTRTARTQ